MMKTRAEIAFDYIAGLARRQMPGGHVVRDSNGQALVYVYSRENEAEALPVEAGGLMWLFDIPRQRYRWEAVPMTAPVWPISHLRSSRVFGTSILAFAVLLVSSQLSLAQFTQQGPKLVGSEAVGGVVQGVSVALAASNDT